MPTYTYQCDNCGVRFDRRQKFSEKPLIVCPECSKKTLRKVFTPVGIVFKGSGFYATDNRSPSGMTHKDGTSKDEGKSKNSSDEKKKGEEKKETKVETKSGTNNSE
jgi:putative FmdB family regulatory protein